VIAAGLTTPAALVTIASVQTLVRRLDTVPAPDLVFVDEAHHAVAGSWGRVLSAWPRAFIIGLTATPERLDGRGLGDVFERIITGPSTADLIRDGFLSPFRAFAPGAPDLSGVKTALGEFDRDGIDEAMNRPSITGDIVSTYGRLAEGKRAIAFASSIEHSRNIVAAFNDAGVPAAHVDGGTPKGERREALAAFAAGSVRVLSNVDLFGEGFDLPAVEVVILARPTRSLSLHLQQIGRALRPAAGKDAALILDHAGNLARHGLPDEPRVWSLDAKARRGREKSASRTTVRRCPRCFSTFHAASRVCPECGFRIAPEPRSIEKRVGELREIARDNWTGGVNIAKARGSSLRTLVDAAAGDLRKLRSIARAKGYRRGWVMHEFQRYQERTGRGPHPD